MILRARIVAPLCRPAIEDGAVLVRGGRILAVGRWKELRSEADGQPGDLGEVVLMPGLVNAHCHLDYTDLAGEIPPPASFTDWIKSILSLKLQFGYSEYAHSWLQGAKMLLRSGTTTVADIEAVPALLPEVWSATPLRVRSFIELTGLISGRDPAEMLEDAHQLIRALPAGRSSAGLSPHSPYATRPELLQLSAKAARDWRWRLTTHVSESVLEFNMFVYRHGEMFDWLKRSGRNMEDCGLGSPIQHLDRHGILGPDFLAVHANYLWEHDAELLAARGSSVVHCPRSHAYFGHRCFPFTELFRAGVNVCLGTDSLVSTRKQRGENLSLNMFAEMRAMAANHSDLAPGNLVRMATIHGARALGMEGFIGELSPGAHADAIAIPYAGGIDDLLESIVQHRGDVAASMIGGEWAVSPESIASKAAVA